MYYCVVPRELEGELFERLRSYYAQEPEIAVIVDRRFSERRGQHSYRPALDKRIVRDRRRRRVCGDLPALRGELPADAA
jgi:hypothetical protein